MDLDYYLSQADITPEKKRASTFKVIPIGGPDEVKAWRLQQEAKEAVYQIKLGARDARIAAFEEERGQKLDRATVRGKSWKDKWEQVQSERRIEAATLNRDPIMPVPVQEPLKFPWLPQLFKRLWKAANF